MPTTFGDRLQERRKEKGLTLEDLAKKVGSTKSYLWELENKPSIRPSAELVHKLAVALGTTVDDLMGAPAPNSEDQVFFREYQQLEPATKKRIRRILDALKDEG